MSHKSKSETSRIERIFFWIGSICGILTSSITIYDRVIAPAPPKLKVTFFESASPELNIVPPIDTRSELTEQIPVRLKIQNLGGKASANTKLYLTYNPSIQIEAEYKKELKQTWTVPNQPEEQLGLTIENLNPSESFIVPLKVRFRVPIDEQRKWGKPRAELAARDLNSMAFNIGADLSSDTVANVHSNLDIYLGRCDVLIDRAPDVFWVGHNEQSKNPDLLKVKDDYPCR